MFVSAASPWELAIKAKKGKLRFTGSPAALIEANGFLPLAISPAHAEAAGSLAWDGADPFDRVLVVQAQHQRVVLVHADANIRVFPGVTQMWAVSARRRRRSLRTAPR